MQQNKNLFECNEEAVTWAVRLFFGREPSKEEIDIHLRNMSFDSLRQAMFKTKEFGDVFKKIRHENSDFLVPSFLLPTIEDQESTSYRAKRIFQPPTIEDPTSQLCTYSQFEEQPFVQWLETLKIPRSKHRKVWEFVFILAAMEKSGILRPGAKALGFGTGKEPIPSVLTKFGLRVTATDAPSDLNSSKAWGASNQHSKSLDDLLISDIVEPGVFYSLATWVPVDMNQIPLKLRGFDVCWSACALEHLGSIDHGLNFIKNSLDTLVPGGFAIHTTEFNLSSNEATLQSPGLSVFRKRDIEMVADELTQAGHIVYPLNFYPGNHAIDEVIDLPPFSMPHLKLSLQGYTCTSAIID